MSSSAAVAEQREEDADKPFRMEVEVDRGALRRTKLRGGDAAPRRLATRHHRPYLAGLYRSWRGVVDVRR